MNTNQINNRKAQIIESIKAGLRLRNAVAPGELLALVSNADPLNFERGVGVLTMQTGVDSDEMLDYQIDNECCESALEVARHTVYMDPERSMINAYKYENSMIPDDELLAFALFFIADSDLVTSANETGEVEFDDVANLINHMANRMKFFFTCLREKRYDILNLIVHYARKYKSEDIDTRFCFDTVTPDDGGVIEYFNSLVDVNAFRSRNMQMRAERIFADPDPKESMNFSPDDHSDDHEDLIEETEYDEDIDSFEEIECDDDLDFIEDIDEDDLCDSEE